MAKWIEGFDHEGYNDWLATLPEDAQVIGRRLKPDVLYRLKNSGHRVTLFSLADDGTVTVDVTGQFNRVLFGRRVFGINPDDLEECDLPAPGEDVGDTAREAGYTEDDIRNILIPKLKEDREQREKHSRN